MVRRFSDTYLSVLSAHTLFCYYYKVQKEDKVTAAGKIVKSVDGQLSKTDLRRPIKDCNIYKNGCGFKRGRRKPDPDSRPTFKRQVSVCLVRETDGSAAWQQAFKNTDMKQAQVQSLLFAVVLATRKTVTNLIPGCIIQRLLCSDNMNLCRGKARGGDLTDDWAKDGGQERMMDSMYSCTCVRERDSLVLFVLGFFSNAFYILWKGEMAGNRNKCETRGNMQLVQMFSLTFIYLCSAGLSFVEWGCSLKHWAKLRDGWSLGYWFLNNNQPHE